jgi:hypothetical protein
MNITDHEFIKFNPDSENNNILLLDNNLTKEILEDGREAYSIFLENKIINIIRIPEHFKNLKNEKAFIRMSVVDKKEKKYVNSNLDDIAIID